MTESPAFTARDRVLVVAPHPDDEAIATGGALQVVRAAGAACRVLVVTDGDNNPWPQRWIEKRWHIGAADRGRWGARRRGEALAALEILGVPADDARCLGFPDLGLTDLLMAGPGRLDALLAAQLDEFAPNCLFLPALADRHPDHSALHVLLRLALLRGTAQWPRLLTFGVHGAAPSASTLMLNLTPEQQAAKRAAIMRHETQMRLSRSRFVAYAQAREPFGDSPSAARPDPDHPVAARHEAGAGVLRITIDRERFGRGLRGHEVFVVALRGDGSRVQWRVPMTGSAATPVLDAATNRRADTAVVEQTHTRLTLQAAADWRAAWIKLARPQPGLFVLDRFGWQTIDCAD